MKGIDRGYANIYVNVEDCDLAQSSTSPTDEEIQMATNKAWAEADSLFSMLGPAPEQFMQLSSKLTTSTQLTYTYLPLAASWFSEGEDSVLDFGTLHCHSHCYLRICLGQSEVFTVSQSYRSPAIVS